jgi:succinate dehydrogenase flavin-adding protein (antitoxin of CptAB toxin-antitoxin module)
VDRRPLRRPAGARHLLTPAGIPPAYRYINAASDGPESGRRQSAIGGTGLRGWRNPHRDRRRRLRFRAWHCGIRETDSAGRFADAEIAAFIVTTWRLLDIPDHDILAWVTGAAGAGRRCSPPRPNPRLCGTR